VVLIICFLIKILGGNWFELAVENEKFVLFCDFIDNTPDLKILLTSVIYCISTYFVVCAIVGKNKLPVNQSVILIIYMLIRAIISWYYEWIAFAMDFILIPGITTLIGKSFKRSVIGFLLLNAFQIISLVTRNININSFNNQSYVFMLLLQIDYYIMIFMYYLYSIRKKGVE
jgi:hypothetical protein